MIIKMKINGIPKDYAQLPFGRQIEYRRVIEQFKSEKSVYLSQKRQSWQKAIKDAIWLYGVKEYYTTFHCDSNCKDDTFQFWYR